MSRATQEFDGVEGWRRGQERSTHVAVREACGVYFIRCGAFVKIGQSVNIVRREKDLQGWNPYPVKVVGFVPCTGPRLFELEEQIHRLLATSHHRGEWFKLSDEVKQYIRTQTTRWASR